MAQIRKLTIDEAYILLHYHATRAEYPYIGDAKLRLIIDNLLSEGLLKTETFQANNNFTYQLTDVGEEHIRIFLDLSEFSQSTESENSTAPTVKNEDTSVRICPRCNRRRVCRRCNEDLLDSIYQGTGGDYHRDCFYAGTLDPLENACGFCGKANDAPENYMIDMVAQEEDKGCVIACIATVLEKKYWEVRKDFVHNFKKSGISLDEASDYLQEHGAQIVNLRVTHL